jgi:hypothetical protein
MTFTVKRSEWMRACPAGGCLLAGGMRCCIGFVAQQLGFADDEIRGYGRLDDLDMDDLDERRIESLRECGIRHGGAIDAGWISAAYSINDSTLISDERREAQLIELFTAKNHELVFID